MLRYGLVTEYSKGKARVKFGEDGIVTKFLPIIYNRTSGDTDFFELAINEQVACIMYGEDGVIIGSIYSEVDQFPSEGGSKIWGKKFEDGTILKYDQSNHKLFITLSGSGAKVEISGDVKITGDVDVTGKIGASGDIKTTGGDVKTATVSVNSHTHSGVQPSGGTSGPPVPTP